MRMIGNWMAQIIKDHENVELQEEIREKVKALCSRFVVYGGM